MPKDSSNKLTLSHFNHILVFNFQNSDLELLVKSKDEVLVTKEEELEEALVKLDKMAQIQNMIHDISSRRVDK